MANEQFLKDAQEYLATAEQDEVIDFIESVARQRPDIADALKAALKARLSKSA